MSVDQVVHAWLLELNDYESINRSCRTSLFDEPTAVAALGVGPLPALIGYLRQHLVRPFYIPSSSMSSTLLKGDMLFGDLSYNCPICFKAVKRSDVAIFVYPDNRTQYFVKRIVARHGDTIEIVAGAK